MLRNPILVLSACSTCRRESGNVAAKKGNSWQRERKQYRDEDDIIAHPVWHIFLLILTITSHHHCNWLVDCDFGGLSLRLLSACLKRSYFSFFADDVKERMCFYIVVWKKMWKNCVKNGTKIYIFWLMRSQQEEFKIEQRVLCFPKVLLEFLIQNWTKLQQVFLQSLESISILLLSVLYRACYDYYCCSSSPQAHPLQDSSIFSKCQHIIFHFCSPFNKILVPAACCNRSLGEERWWHFLNVLNCFSTIHTINWGSTLIVQNCRSQQVILTKSIK